MAQMHGLDSKIIVLWSSRIYLRLVHSLIFSVDAFSGWRFFSVSWLSFQWHLSIEGNSPARGGQVWRIGDETVCSDWTQKYFLCPNIIGFGTGRLRVESQGLFSSQSKLSRPKYHIVQTSSPWVSEDGLLVIHQRKVSRGQLLQKIMSLVIIALNTH